MKFAFYALLAAFALNLFAAEGKPQYKDEAPQPDVYKEVKRNWKEHTLQLENRHVMRAYYTSNSFGKDNKTVVCYSHDKDFNDPRVHIYDIAQSKFVKEVKLEKMFSGQNCTLGANYSASQNCVYLTRYNKIYKVNLNDGKTSVFFEHPLKTAALHSGDINRAETLMVMGVYVNNPDKKGQYSYLGFCVIDLKTGKAIKDVGMGNYRFVANHFQFMDDNPDYIMYAHEGETSTIPDRINRINWKTGWHKILHNHYLDKNNGSLIECIGHEMTGGNKIAAVRYSVSKIPGALVAMNTDGSDYKVVDYDNYWHCAINADGTVYVADTMWWGNTKRVSGDKKNPKAWIILLDSKTKTKEVLKSFRGENKHNYYHPHPAVSSDGRLVYFSEGGGEFVKVTLFELLDKSL